MTAKPNPTPTFRDWLIRISPVWLRTGNNARLLFSIGLQLDVMGDAIVAAVKLRFPGYYSFESLPFIGSDRRITRGPFEVNETYAHRLTRWLDDHRRRGNPYALLAQLHAYYSPNTFPIDLIYRSGRRFRMAVDGTITRDDIPFSPDTNRDKWARWWLYYYTDAFPQPLSPEQTRSLKLVPTEWNAAHCLGRLCIMPMGAEQWNFPLQRKWNRHVKWNKPRGVTLDIDE